MRKAIAVAATILLFATAVSGCLGGKLVTRQASELILTASDIPGNWTVVSSIDHPTMDGNMSSGASRDYQNAFLNQTRIAIIVWVYVSIESAKFFFSNLSWLIIGANHSNPGIGDEAQMITRNFNGFGEKEMIFRKGNVVIGGGVWYPVGAPLTDPWFINLMTKQASKID